MVCIILIGLTLWHVPDLLLTPLLLITYRHFINGNNMSKEIDNIFVDVRNAFRLLNRYQKRILQIVSYIREQTAYTDMWGKKDWYSNEIGKRRNSPDPEYAKLSVQKDMWGWDFLYGYVFEYYFGRQRINKKNVEMSIFQISDDGFFISSQDKKHMTDVSSFESSESSHSYLVLFVSVFTTKYSELWLSDPNFPDDEMKDFLTKFLSSPIDTKITKNEKGEVAIIKKYELQRFASQHEADDVIRDFGRIVKQQASIELFKNSFFK